MINTIRTPNLPQVGVRTSSYLFWLNDDTLDHLFDNLVVRES